MSFPPPPPLPMGVSFLPPLPAGWSEYHAPDGNVYYFNVRTRESTYVRPLPDGAPLAGPSSSTADGSQPQKKKKEKLQKTPIPGTDWLRVATAGGDTFYTHKGRKESVWTVPEEITQQVVELERVEREAKEKEDEGRRNGEEEERRLEEERRRKEGEEREDEMRMEVERVKAEIIKDAKGKRKVSDAESSQKPSKKAKIEGEGVDEDEEDMAWQLEMAEEMAAEAEAEKGAQRPSSPKGVEKESQVELSLEEGKALFKALLQEKDINPLLPWDLSLPLFISDPRYTSLKSAAARREVFDEYCRERSRAHRIAKAQAASAGPKKTPKEEFDALLREEAKSTRAGWDEWRRKWKKDRRFYGWGRDEREREKRYREWMKELGEIKRGEAKRAEEGFFKLLKETRSIKPDSTWKEVKRNIADDMRYDAVGSSSLREELFGTYVNTLASLGAGASKTEEELEAEQEAEKEAKRKDKAERAVREREDKVREQQRKIEEEMIRSREGLSKDEGELLFKSLLVDAVRDPRQTWDEMFPSFKRDPRYIGNPVSTPRLRALFDAHISALINRQLILLHDLFLQHAPELSAQFSTLPISESLESQPALKLRIDTRGAMQDEFDRWMRRRTTEAREAFDVMLGENSFVEFWGRLRKEGESKGTKIKGVVGDDDEEEGVEGEGGGGQVDLKALARGVDIREMERVLKHDKRYIMFSHVPEQRTKWIEDYVSRLSAPKLSVHVPQSSSNP